MSSDTKDKPLAVLKSEQCMKQECPQDMESVWLTVKQEPLEEQLPVQDIQRESPQVKDEKDIDYNLPNDEVDIEDHCISPGKRSDEVLNSSSDEDVSDVGTSVSADVPLQPSLTSTSIDECHNFRTTFSEDHGTEEKYKIIQEMSSQYPLVHPTPHNVPDIYKTIDTKRSYTKVIQKEVSGDTVKAYYSCSNCGKCFTLHSEILQHLKIHSEKKIHKCTECGKCFSYRSKLKTHLNIHSGEKVYKCTECGEGFAQSCTLRIHLRIHSNKKYHKCTDCGKCFTRSSTLTTHLKIHSGEKNHKCTECGKCFTRNCSLMTHLKIHAGVKDHKCSECGKCFTQRITLNRHLKIHSGEKDYKCPVCGKYFTQSSTLRTHVKIHNGQKDDNC